MEQSNHPLTDYLSFVGNSDVNALLGLFTAEPHLDDPQFGRVTTTPAFHDYVATASTWLAERKARLEPVALTQTPQRAVYELVLHLEQDGRSIPLPVALVGDMAGDKLSAVRI